MKKTIVSLLIVLLLLAATFIAQNYPFSSEAKNLPTLSDTMSIRRHLEAIIHTSKSRSYLHTAVLDSVSQFIKEAFLKNTTRVTEQKFEVRNRFYQNIIASFGPENGERIIVGAHYDVCGDQDGADDNASGVAGVLGLAELLKDKNLKYRIDLVAYSLEEPPFFETDYMGSYVHAKSLHDGNIRVKGMVSLEMIGYFSEKENSQSYPLGFLKWFYGNKGDYITIVQKPFNGSFSKQFTSQSLQHNSIRTATFNAPSFLGGIDLSDHRNYWKFGYSSVMVTNTAFYRNNNYHLKGDAFSTLNIPNIGLVVDGVFRVLTELE